MKNTVSIGVEKIVNNFSYSGLQENSGYLIIDDEYVRCIYVSGYPYIATNGWMENLVKFNSDCDVSFFVEQIEAKLALPKLTRKITEFESIKRAMLKDGRIISSEINDPLNSAVELRDKITRGQEKLFQFSIYIAIRAKNLENLNKITTLLETTLSSKLFYIKNAYFQQLDAMQSILPRLTDNLKQKRNLNSTSAALSFPFISSELFYEKGILYGINKSNDSLVIVDRFALNNANSIVFAQSGSGKSYLSKVEILRQLNNKTQVIVIDPESEYKNICNKVNGSYVEISVNSRFHINPFDTFESIRNRSKTEYLQDITQLIEILAEGLNPEEKAAVDRILINLYNNDSIEKNIISFQKIALKENQISLSERLEKYVSGSLSTLFTSPTNINMDNRLIVFDIKNLPDNIKNLMMLILSNFIYNKVKFEPKKRMLVIDEGWMLLENETTAKFISGLVRRARKYYLGVSIITQQANDFLNNHYGRAIASQSAMRILMKQDTTTINNVVKEFSLSSYERKYLLNCYRGDALMILDQNHVAVEIIASKSEHPLITTNPKETIK